ncbi:MAG: hypothetical protein ACOVSW_23360 [Candidatus Kapaibacteriota bacterium]
MENNNTTPQSRLDEALQRYGTSAAFSPLFAERVQRRIVAKSEEQLSPLDALAEELLWLFRRTALVGGVLVALLVWYNIAASGEISVGGALGLTGDAHELPIESVLMLD